MSAPSAVPAAGSAENRSGSGGRGTGSSWSLRSLSLAFRTLLDTEDCTRPLSRS